jgi:lysozyme family protein
VVPNPLPSTTTPDNLFDTVLAPLIIGEEGGYTNDPNDSGGETNWGLTVAVARANGYTGSMSSMTKPQALVIYKAKYYMQTGVYLISPVSLKIAADVFDYGVNAGVGTAVMFLQKVLNLMNNQGKDYADVKVDGGCGPGTVAALKAFLTKRGQAEGETVLQKALGGEEYAHYRDIATTNPTQEEYFYGWVANRVV